jgi:tetratricopeptide (TPR) repeat protein
MFTFSPGQKLASGVYIIFPAHVFPKNQNYSAYSPNKNLFLPMKQVVFVLSLCLFATSILFAQKADTTKQKEHLALYHRAIGYNDLSSAAYSLTGYLLNGGEEKFNDTLALVYYNMNNLGGAYKLAGEINTKDPKNATALTLLADISGRAGEVKKSLEWYEKLVEISPLPYNYYQLATKQFVLERTLECKQSLQKAIADSAQAKQQKVRLDIGEGYGEDVPVFAAAMNMMGAIAYKENDKAAAASWYKKAIDAFPQFVIAKQNLEELNKPAKTPTVAKPPVKKG